MSEYCTICGNKGLIPETDEPCECGCLEVSEIEGEITSLAIPEQYRDIVFNEVLVPMDLGDKYVKEIKNLYTDIVNLRLHNKNIFFGAPSRHSKTIMAYASQCKLFRKGIEVFPLFDIREIGKIMQDIDFSRKPVYLEGLDTEPMILYTAPILIVRLVGTADWFTYETMVSLTSRRTRRGKDTIYLCDTSWEWFTENDKKGILKSLVGDGSYGTIKNISFWKADATND